MRSTMSDSPTPEPPARTACQGVLTNTAGYSSARYQGRVVYFCLRACLRAFEADPDRFMAGEVEHPTQEEDEAG